MLAPKTQLEMEAITPKWLVRCPNHRWYNRAAKRLMHGHERLYRDDDTTTIDSTGFNDQFVHGQRKLFFT